MHPSQKGAFKVRARDVSGLIKHWKTRILSFRQRKTRLQLVNEALVQHVFLHKDIRVHPKVQMQRHMPNMLYPSDSIEWQRIECFTEVMHVFHVEIGKLLYEGKSSRQLADEAIFFYSSKYIVPKGRYEYGTLEPLPLPKLDSREWPACNSSILHTCTPKLSVDILNAMKPSIGSLNWFIPIVIFGHIFKSCVGLHRTRCTYIMKNLSEEWLCKTFGKNWGYKASSDLETIECRVSSKDVVFRYFIGRQTLCMVFKYQRCRLL
ncbi:hypothetical protein GOP47_0024093 [Adiantum capillus-veneris]|uniref:Uncharacterized protein n=1 Tax=Adiantum capillus-veneris TaxID=13818 RepID=A0A9D4U3Y0_ADICA|nr:hypothetical protein GOP47_0023452 [Adiantum capillus-veneris]KAI5061588.1 hypothetical protein GOP47_0024093 [Adiantum capillus-veneris]